MNFFFSRFLYPLLASTRKLVWVPSSHAVYCLGSPPSHVVVCKETSDEGSVSDNCSSNALARESAERFPPLIPCLLPAPHLVALRPYSPHRWRLPSDIASNILEYDRLSVVGLSSFSPAGSVAPLLHLWAGRGGGWRRVGTRYAGSTFNTTIVTPVATISYVTGTPGFPPSIHFTFFFVSLFNHWFCCFFLFRVFFIFLLPLASSSLLVLFGFQVFPLLVVLAAAVVFIYSSIPLRTSSIPIYIL